MYGEREGMSFEGGSEERGAGIKGGRNERERGSQERGPESEVLDGVKFRQEDPEEGVEMSEVQRM